LDQLRSEGLFNKNHLPDMIALLFIFMPRIRSDFYKYVRVWNNHNIRKQSKRPHVISGTPEKLYHRPDTTVARDCKVTADPDRLRFLQDLIKADNIDLDQYLPTSMMELCDRIIQDHGGLPVVFNEETRNTPYLQEYLHLRSVLTTHHNEQWQPPLELLVPTTGSLVHIKRLMEEHGIILSDVDVGSSSDDIQSGDEFSDDED